MNLNELKTDKTLENEGVWVEDVFPGVRIKIRAASYRPFGQQVEKKQKPFKLLGKEPSVEELNEIIADAMSEHLVLDWDGLEDDNGPIPYSPAVGKKVLLEYERLTARILEESGSIANFKRKKEEEVAKKSQT